MVVGVAVADAVMGGVGADVDVHEADEVNEVVGVIADVDVDVDVATAREAGRQGSATSPAMAAAAMIVWPSL